MATYKSRNDLLDGEFRKLLAKDDDLTALRYRVVEAENQLNHSNGRFDEVQRLLEDSENQRNGLLQKMDNLSTEYANYQKKQLESLEFTREELSK